jgi:CheY-like chemotaxis protein
LRNAQLQAISTEDPLEGLQRLSKEKYALVLLDIEMPAIDGLEFFKRLRELPGYRKTPVIYVTSHSGFESRAKIALSGGADLLAKPVFPMELAVKAMTHLLSGQLIGAK